MYETNIFGSTLSESSLKHFSYLDRQDFLERADHRQYEIERDMRMSRRSNR